MDVVRGLLAVTLASGAVLLAGCDRITNSPHASGAEKTNTFFTAFQERSPKYLDPTASYSLDETPYTYSIFEPLYRFHYLKRPYEVAPRAAEAIATPRYYDKDGRELPADAPGDQIAESVYDIKIRKGILYSPHPAFAKDEAGNLRYHALKPEDLGDKRTPFDFEHRGTRELTAHDYVYGIKRLATTRIKSPSFSPMAEHIKGLKDYGVLISKEDEKLRNGKPLTDRNLPFLDFRQFPLAGVEAIDDHTLRIRLDGKYPQFKYWLTMSFFSPVPWEVDRFYAQPGMAERNLSMNYWPVGTGPYMLTEYQENRRHVLSRNPNFRGEPYPCEGEKGDEAAGLLADCGKPMPFIDQVVFSIEKERIPHKTKFMQGYYDNPEISRFDWLLDLDYDVKNSEQVAQLFRERGIQMPKTLEISNWYLGFNWWDPVVGKGKTPEEQERNRKLRQALSIAIDWEEYVRVFESKAAGEPAMSAVPPGVFAYRPEAINRTVYDIVDGKPRRKSIAEAKRLLAEAGYPDGRDAKTGQPLVLNYDYQRALTPELKAEVDWMVKQFAKIGVQLELRATDYNRFQDKADKGSLQIFWWGWFADYPDAENFLFLLYGPNSQAATQGNGNNTANYQNAEFDKLFEEMRYLDDVPRKQQVVDQMIAILQKDAPWAFGYNPYAGSVHHGWVGNVKPAPLANDRLMYMKVDPELRAAKIAEWNRPIWWPVVLIVLAIIAAIVPAYRSWKRRERETAGRTLAVARSGQ
ncbi:MAG TPA: ABC transporter substrate-binding protein [Burkholderiaceae bacterium]|nr:ABC transporter substrate-binding protein [Burkholderiaceae bacterium]